MRGCWGRVLIETLWNVNYFTVYILWDQWDVLIETLWNVNEDEKARVCDDANVLIETLWNVNDHGRKQR